MGLDYREFERFAKEMKDFQKEHEKWIRAFLLRMGLEALAQVKKRTPVDTGELRNSWYLSDVFRNGDTLVIYLTNNKDYASHVEYGHRQKRRWVPGEWVGGRFKYDPESESGMLLKDKWIEGYFMATVTMNDIERKLPKRYEKAMQEFIKKLGVSE